MECWMNPNSITPTLHHSNTPPLHHLSLRSFENSHFKTQFFGGHSAGFAGSAASEAASAQQRNLLVGRVSFAPLLEGDPDLAGVVRFERRGWAAPQRWPDLWRSIRRIREQAFDWVLDLQSLARSGAVAWLANGKLTIGLDEPRTGARGLHDRIARGPSFQT